MQKSVHPPAKYSCSELINIGEFLANNVVDTLLPSQPYHRKSTEKRRIADVLKVMKTDLEKDLFLKLESYCRPENLAISSEYFQKVALNPLDREARFFYQPLQITDEARKFKTVSKLEERIKIDPVYTFKKILKYQNDVSVENHDVDIEQIEDLIPGKEVLIRIRIYRPFRNSEVTHNGPRLSHDLVVLGSQTLDVLRDNINCPNDLRTLHDISETPSLEPNIFSKDVFKSAFFYIEDTFYNDMRDSNNADNSKVIMDWARNKDDIGILKSTCMASTTFNELKVRLGFPQIYQHQGNCEHLFVFSDIEILQPSDSCCSSSYPHYKTITSTKATYCNMCGRFVAKWLVQGNNRVPFEPSYFCEDCFISYNYIDGKKIGNFRAFPLFDKGSGL